MLGGLNVKFLRMSPWAILFIIYINDLPLEIKKSILDEFGDDTTMSRSVNLARVQQLTDHISEDGEDSGNWCVYKRTNCQ